ncbi:MAG: DUF362 domain-containing protein [Acidobacteria bacterium]|nr:DUF362 domain-containing protein [Acidobacteriota bacterium]
MTRRELLALVGAASAWDRPLAGRETPTAPVAIVRSRSYEEDLGALLATPLDQLGGVGRLVKGKTVTIKLNLTGSPGLRLEGRPPGVTHYTHPRVAGTLAHLLGRAGARRIRFVESCWGTGGPLEEYLLDSGWNVRALATAASNVEFENTNSRGRWKGYARLKVPGGGRIYPAYDLNRAYEDTDVFVSLAKLKEHGTCGVTLSLKNVFGNTPASIYGDDAGREEPNESPTKGRLLVFHEGKRQPSASAPRELDQGSSRDPGYRVPHIVAELAAARPIHLAIIDGIQTVAGGEGPWMRGLRLVEPGLLIAGTNPVTTDAVATAAMGFDPGATRGQTPFGQCENTLRLAEALGLGTTDLRRVEVRGLPLDKAVFRFAA